MVVIETEDLPCRPEVAVEPSGLQQAEESSAFTQTVAALRKMTARSVYDRLTEESMSHSIQQVMVQNEAVRAAYLGCVLRYTGLPQIDRHCT